MLSDPLILRHAWKRLGTRTHIHACVHTYTHTHAHRAFLKHYLESCGVNSERTRSRQTNRWIFMTCRVCVCVYLGRGEVNESHESGKGGTMGWKRSGQREDRTQREGSADSDIALAITHQNRDTLVTSPPSLQLPTPPPYMIQPSSSLSVFQLRHTFYFNSWRY